MKNKFLTASIIAVAIGYLGIVPLANAAANDSVTFSMVKSAGAVSCLNPNASGRFTISDLGPVQNLHVEVFNLPPNTDFTLFVITIATAPFVPAWYQGDLTTNATGKGVLDVTGIFSDETFILNPGTPPVATEMRHLRNVVCRPRAGRLCGMSGTVTPFDGDHGHPGFEHQ